MNGELNMGHFVIPAPDTDFIVGVAELIALIALIVGAWFLGGWLNRPGPLPDVSVQPYEFKQVRLTTVHAGGWLAKLANEGWQVTGTTHLGLGVTLFLLQRLRQGAVAP